MVCSPTKRKTLTNEEEAKAKGNMKLKGREIFKSRGKLSLPGLSSMGMEERKASCFVAPANTVYGIADHSVTLPERKFCNLLSLITLVGK